jgi:hypothetical protein
MVRNLSAAAAILVAAAAFAAPRDTVTFNNVVSNGPDGNAANGIQTFNAVGGYTAYKMLFSGDVQPVNTGTFQSELRIKAINPLNATVATVQPFTTAATWAGVLSFSTEIDTADQDPAGMWTFRFYESFDDGGTASIDANWDAFTITWDDQAPPPPPPPPADDLGDIDVGTQIVADYNLAAGEVHWYRINVVNDVTVGNGIYCDLHTDGSALAPTNDTEIGVYSSPSGALLDNDDDGGNGLLSQLSYGAGRRLGFANGLNFEGQAGDLLTGEYYVAVSGFNATFGAANYTVTSTSVNTGLARFTVKCGRPPCSIADINSDGQVDFFDYLDFVVAFDAGC